MHGIEHRREQDLSGERRRLLVARHQRERRREIAAGLFARDEQAGLLARPSSRGWRAARSSAWNGRLSGVGKRMLRARADSRAETTTAPGLGEQRRDRASAVERAADEGAAMQMQHQRRGAGRAAPAHRSAPACAVCRLRCLDHWSLRSSRLARHCAISAAGPLLLVQRSIWTIVRFQR